ncbi:hypothetical protein [Flavobacterium sp.]|uniref:hypothetical protein n=1 Tax=Flavobacterium sp. TaxID=239 RepID=UPI002628E234|nr:hypothetical protein [Flavobacterium sp.]
MKKTIRLCFLITLFLSAFIYAQNDPVKEKLVGYIQDYFSLDREIIHVQLDKNIFFSDEQIWFKGYVLQRKTKKLFASTTNVFAVLLDADGNKVSEQLVFANSGSFSGTIKLTEKCPSGDYYLQFYTNWMNNFSEDESSIYRLTIINSEKPFTPSQKPDYSRVNVNVYPEGGNNIIFGVRNTVGIQISDCKDRPIPVTEGEIIDEKGTAVTKVFLNKFGYGKFDFIPNAGLYKAVFNINGNLVETPVPYASTTGIALEVNNHAFADRTLILLRANKEYVRSLKNKTFFVLVHQDQKSTIYEISLSDNTDEQKIIISKADFADGINTIRVIDADLNEVCQRLIFKKPTQHSSLEISPSAKAINTFTVQTEDPKTNLSISVLPDQSIADNGSDDIFGSAYLNPYLSTKIPGARYYFEASSKAKDFELDLLLLNQKQPKYRWTDIVSKKPKEVSEFDYGLTVKGLLNQKLADPEKYRIKLYSVFAGIDEYAKINEKNEFYFKNLVVRDSSHVSISLIKIPEITKPLPLKMNAKVINAKRSYRFLFHPEPSLCIAQFEPVVSDLPTSTDKKEIQLDEVKVEYKYKLTRQMNYGNALLKGYKVVPENNGLDVLNFIRNHGFDVEKNKGKVAIYGRSRTTINGQRNQPVVFIDAFRLMSFDELDGMRMDDIDEIYLDAHAIVPSVTNNIGVIKIYRKKASQYAAKEATSNAVDFTMEGYEMIRPFSNAAYLNKSGKGFEDFGLIHWIPNLLTDESGASTFQIPPLAQQTVKLLIEGISADGNLISEIKIIPRK